MQFKHSLGFFALAAIVAALPACNKTVENADDTIEFKTLTSSKVYRLEGTAKVFMSDSDICFQDSANLVFPTKIRGRDITALQDSIVRLAFDTVGAVNPAMDAYFAKTVAEQGYPYKEVPDSTPRTDYDGSTIIDGEVYSMSAEMLTYRISNYSYMPGAAHGLTIQNYLTYSIRMGKMVSLADLFTPEGLAKLPDMLRTRAKQLEAAIGPTDITALPSGNNFFISLDGSIVFVYQPYEVASYAQGAIAISFYPYQLTELLSDEGMKLFHLN